MGSIAQALQPVLVAGAHGLLGGDDVLDDDAAAGAGDAGHLPDDDARPRQVVERRPADHEVEAAIWVGELMRVGGVQDDVGGPSAAEVPVEGDDALHARGEGGGEHAGADIEDAVAALRLNEVD